MKRLALFGGDQAVRVTRTPDPLLCAETVDRLHRAVEAARYDWSYLSGIGGSGPVAQLEEACRQATGVRYALAVSSGTAALFTALLACGVGPGDEVIVPAYTWGQSAAPILHLGARPVFADIDPARYTLDPAGVIRLITQQTRSIVVVHLLGQMADMPALCRIARAHRLSLVEDCAQAFGARLHGRPAGTWGDAGCVSFGREKPVTGGEGGLLLTNRASVFERAVALTQHPIRQRFELRATRRRQVGEAGYNFRIHPLAAVIACGEISGCESRRLRRVQFYDALSATLRDVPGIQPPLCGAGCDHAWYRYCPTWVPSDLPHNGISRDVLLDALVAEGVPVFTDPIGVPLHHRPEFSAGSKDPCSLPVAEKRCYRSGIAFASWLPEYHDASLLGCIRAAFEKVVAASAELSQIPHGLKERKGRRVVSDACRGAACQSSKERG